jgi:acetyl-CoA acyltransferase 1
MAATRLQVLRAHLESSSRPVDVRDVVFTALDMSATNPSCAKDDVVVVSAFRTPMCKAKRGGLRDTAPDALLIAVLKATMERAKIDPNIIGDIVVGNVLQAGAGAHSARMAQLVAGIPHTVPLSVVNRQCSSGLQVCWFTLFWRCSPNCERVPPLQAVMNVAQAIAAGAYDCGEVPIFGLYRQG